MDPIFSYLKENQKNMEASLEKLARAESPSQNKELVDACGHVIQSLFSEHLGLDAIVFKQKKTGNHLKFTFGNEESVEQILITTHFDTVWEKGRLALKKEEGKFYGPGVLDMKCGIVQTLWALKAIQELDYDLNKRIVILCTSDEEIGSKTSQDLIKSEAIKSVAVLVPEPAAAKSGALKTARKGVGRYTINVKGVSAHAGNHHEEGVNAVEELAYHIVEIQNLTDYDNGTTVNVGAIHGGGAVNVVPDEAMAEIDVRVSTESEARKVEKNIHHLKPKLEGVKIEVEGGINRPPMRKTSGVEYLFSLAKKMGEQIGFEVTEDFVGGGSDGNFTAALGIPTLDGLGAVGEGPHAENEHVILDKIPERSALLAHLLLEI